MIRTAIALTAMMLATAATAQNTAEEAYVEANLLSIFYHELGHALVDVMALPVFGQEEDAADTASILLIDALFDEDAAQGIARDAAFGFLDEADAADAEPVWWDGHGPDEQRYYNLVCLFYGADPETRDALADELQLPEDRAASCEEEFDLANDSWGPVFDELVERGPGDTLMFQSDTASLTTDLIGDEVAALNAELSLPTPVTVRVAPCEEANAFYDPEVREITICTELEPHLRQIMAGN